MPDDQAQEGLMDDCMAWPTAPKAGWGGADVSMDDLRHALTEAERDILLELTDACVAAGVPLTSITREQFYHPRLEPLFRRLNAQLRRGAGLVFLKNLPVRERPLDTIRMMFWGISLQFGRAISQNTAGELMGEVRVRDIAGAERGYNRPGALIFHSDRTDMLVLFCVSEPLSGGANIFVSSLKVWDVIKAERPDLLERLLRGFRASRLHEQWPGQGPTTEYRVPIFGEQHGLRSAYMLSNYLVQFQKQLFGDELTAEDEEALEYLNAVINRPELALTHTLELGEAVFINNYEILHNRDAFVDGDKPEEKRMLLRMWLEGAPPRPMRDDMLVMRNPSGRRGIDPWPPEARLTGRPQPID